MSLYQKPFVPTQEQKSKFVHLYDADTKQKFGTFYNFYKATEFIVSRKYSIVFLNEVYRNEQYGQEWGLRIWT